MAPPFFLYTMQVKIEYQDNESFTSEEVLYRLEQIFGSNIEVKVSPSGRSPEDFIYFGLKDMVTISQLDIFYEHWPHGYDAKIDELKQKTLENISKILDKVITDNLNKVRE